MDHTTQELASAFRALKMDRAHAQLIQELLSESDLVKFAKLRPPEDQAEAALARAKRVVDVTKLEIEDPVESDHITGIEQD
jgi:hypothetical protein